MDKKLSPFKGGRIIEEILQTHIYEMEKHHGMMFC